MQSTLDDLRKPYFWRSLIAEALGTTFLVFIGCGSCIKHQMNVVGINELHIALAFGLAVATIVWSIAHVSGGHINPAVTIGMLVARRVSLARGVLYVFAQCSGGVAGAALLLALTPYQHRATLGSTLVAESVRLDQAFGIELLITFLLVFAVFATTDEKRTDLHGSGPLAIGLCVAVCHLYAIKYTGSSMNPARSLGPAVIMSTWTNHWIYWCAPLIGGIIAAFLYESLFSANASIKKARAYLLTSNYRNDNFDSMTNNDQVKSPTPYLISQHHSLLKRGDEVVECASDR